MKDGEIKKGAKVAGVINEAEQQNLAEIIQIIESLRKNLKVLDDKEACHEAVEHLDDLEAEAKETNPKKSRLKASLLVLWNLGKDVTAIANGITALSRKIWNFITTFATSTWQLTNLKINHDVFDL
ncbi:MAG: hypothetical protein HC784_05845 [Hydrococcus sp. CSU_1_8]|nr:hypothetical protein [Hydrococcus sp. CSU_1_8]